MIILGRIVAPFGVNGWLRLHPFGDDPLSWRAMPTWWMSTESEADRQGWQAYTLKACRMHGKDLLVSFAEVPDRNAAERLGPMYVGAPREAMPAPASDEYYWADLIGLETVNRAGVRLGRVTGLLETGVHDVLQVQDGDTERLIPFVAAYVLGVDVEGGSISVDWEADW